MSIRCTPPRANLCPLRHLALRRLLSTASVHTARLPVKPATARDHRMSAANGIAASGGQQQGQPQPANGRPPQSAPLGLVVTDAVRRWFTDAHREALKGDVKQQALLGQMLIEGYGCAPDPVAGREWAEKARRRGYRMEGVYDRI